MATVCTVTSLSINILIFLYTDGNLHHADVSLFGEPTEFEYLRKVLFEYMMGRETKVWKVVCSSVMWSEVQLPRCIDPKCHDVGASSCVVCYCKKIQWTFRAFLQRDTEIKHRGSERREHWGGGGSVTSLTKVLTETNTSTGRCYFTSRSLSVSQAYWTLKADMHYISKLL